MHTGQTAHPPISHPTNNSRERSASPRSCTAIQGPFYADDDINLKALPAGDSSGRVFAAVKTSLDDLPNRNLNAPQIMLLVLGQDGEWTSHVFGSVGDHHSRPIVILDEEHRELYMFATAPTGSGTISYKRTDLDNISFPSGKGTPFIQSATDDTLKGLGGNDTLRGEGDNDKLLGRVGNDTLDGGLGTDTKLTDATEKSIVGFS